MDELRDSMDYITICIDENDHKSAMQAIVRFTLLFGDFIQQNSDYIFDREMTNLNRCLKQMLQCMEHHDLQGMKETIDYDFRGFLDKWDFGDDSFIN